jgi:hypothetical protein
VNGAKSNGPKTAAGKARSSQNARKHGFSSHHLVLSSEEEPLYNELLRSYIERFQPADGVEMGALSQLVTAAWRLQRAWVNETRLLELGLVKNRPYYTEKFGGLTMEELTALVCHDFAAKPSYTRYEPFLRRSWERALKMLRELQAERKNFQNEPTDQPRAQPNQEVTASSNEPEEAAPPPLTC